MGWLNKKEEVPEIAPAPTLPELPKKEGETAKPNLPELPSFPHNPENENLNQEIVKSAVTDNLSPGEEEVNVEIPEGLHVTEEVPGGSIPPKPSVASSIPEPPPVTPAPATPTPQPAIPPTPQKVALELNAAKEDKPITKPVEPIYIRIDKFQTAQKNFETVKEKITEIESLLQKVKDVKSQEETELNGWTEDIEKIKARLSEVDSEIFNQL
jgi:hypothetical protein